MSSLFLSIVLCMICATVFFLSYGNRGTDLFYFKLLSVSIFLWSFFASFLYIVPDPMVAYQVHMLKYVGIAFTPIFIYMHIATLTGTKNTNRLALILSIIPAVTSLLALTNQFHPLIHTGVEILGSVASRVSIAQFGYWFYIHTAYSYAFAVLSLVKLVNVFFLIPRTMRKPFWIMMIGVAAVIFTNAAVVFKLVTSSIDPSLVATVVTLLLFYLALLTTNTANIIMTSREQIYLSLSSMIFVLNNAGLIIDCNLKAQALLESLRLKTNQVLFIDFRNDWIANQNGRISAYNSDVITIQANGHEQHFQLHSQEVTYNGEVQGSFVVIQEITQIYELMRYLESNAFFDALTGIANRNAFVIKIDEWDNLDALPLGIIAGDVNQLKTVNDSFGHIVGDELLKASADIMTASAPEKAGVFRIGGDEFVIIIPNSSEEEVERVMHRIKEGSEAYRHNNFGSPSIAVGGVVRNTLDEDIKNLLKQADESMYRDKYDRRRR